MSFEGNPNLQNLFGEDAEPRKGPDGSVLHNDPNITPSILLEQLAYVDNFMPDLDNDFTSFGSLLDGETQGGGLGMDERLAAELSAFADDTFIFPDEDKPRDSDRDDALGDADTNMDNDGQDQGQPSPSRQRDSHFFTQRRNNFLASQYDHSRQRFSSKNKRRSVSQSPAEDHGGFTNVDISEGRPQLFNHQDPPYITSPLSNLVAGAGKAASQQPYSISNTPASNSNTITESSSVATPFISQLSSQRPLLQHAQASLQPQRQQSVGQIHMPDYSSIPTSTLLALLPKIGVPPGAYLSLQNVGFEPDQIDAIAAIIAYYRTKKLHSTVPSQSSTSLGEENPARFLLQFLSNDRVAGSGAQIQNDEIQVGSSSVHAETDHRASILDTTTGGPSETFFHSLLDVNSTKQEADSTDAQSLADSSSSQSEKPSTPETERFSMGIESTTSQKPISDEKDAHGGSQSLTFEGKSGKDQQKPHLKRKLKEQELEKSIQELSELALNLQQRIHTLEMENRLLKNLVMERGELKGIEEVENVRRELIKKISEESTKSDRNKSVEKVMF